MSIDLLAAGLLSHGFKEPDSSRLGWRHFCQRLGKEDRWLRESDLAIWIGDSVAWALVEPMKFGLHEGPKDPGMLIPYWAKEGVEVESYHRLLMKCGEIWLRHRAAFSPPQKVLELHLEEELKEFRLFKGSI